MNLRSYIKVKVAVPGFHYWPGAPIPRTYLGHLHRHLFVVRVQVQVWENDREVEFHDLQHEVRMALDACSNAQFPDDAYDFGSMSCEAIATHVIMALVRKYGELRAIRVEVSEDDECGGLVTFLPPLETAIQQALANRP